MRFLPIREHWTLRYAVDRARVAVHERLNPDAPWLVREGIHVLAEWLRPRDVVVEFGSGRSTSWLARRAGRVISFEDHPEWFAKVKAQLEGSPNAEVVLAPADRSGYMDMVGQRAPQKPDVVLVDGQHRDSTALWALESVERGLIIVDNANWFLPSNTRAPSSVGLGGAPITEEWKEFARRTAECRSVWFSNGVWDTLFVFI